MLTKKECLNCGSPVVGRSDKKFCDDSCRSNFNANLNKEKLSYVREVNAILRRNRGLLEKYNPRGKSRVKKKRLLTSGYDFDYYTHQYTTSTGSVYYFCYEYGYLFLSPEELLLVKKEPRPF